MNTKPMHPELSLEQLQALCDLAIVAAQQAGQRIASYDRSKIDRIFKDVGSSSASQLVTEVDLHSEKIIRQHLASISAQLNIAFVGEESSLNGNVDERFEKRYFWCVDPLDGTLPYVEGRDGFSVSIALVDRTGEALIGVVYAPSNHTLLHAIKGQGCYRNSRAFRSEPFRAKKTMTESLLIYADESFKHHAQYEFAAAALGDCTRQLSLKNMAFSYGSGAVKNACQVLNTHPSCYLKLPKKEDGGGSIWDYAATACIAHEAGAWVSNIYGQPLDLNRRDSTFMNHEGIIYASNGQIAELLIQLLSSDG